MIFVLPFAWIATVFCCGFVDLHWLVVAALFSGALLVTLLMRAPELFDAASRGFGTASIAAHVLVLAAVTMALFTAGDIISTLMADPLPGESM
ncbi:MAG: hypothetical protein QHC90_04090 [Shinella sp.]|nr:hypothetical protein [Shinella sp.]